MQIILIIVIKINQFFSYIIFDVKFEVLLSGGYDIVGNITYIKSLPSASLRSYFLSGWDIVSNITFIKSLPGVFTVIPMFPPSCKYNYNFPKDYGKIDYVCVMG